MPEQEAAENGREPAVPGTSRRGMLAGAAGIGAAGLAAGVFVGAVAMPAGAATTAPVKEDADSVARHGSLVVHIRDTRTGVVDLYTGERHVRFTDHQLAARLARAAG